MPAFTDFCDAKLRRFFELCNLLHEKNASTNIFNDILCGKYDYLIIHLLYL